MEQLLEEFVDYFDLDVDEDNLSINDYAFQAGCYISNGKFLSLAEIVKFMQAYDYI